MTGTYIPPGGFADQGRPSPKLVTPQIKAPIEVLKRLVGAVEWNFEVSQLSNAVASGTPIGNVTPGFYNNFQVQNAFEALIDWVQVGPNMFGGSTAPSWIASLTANGVGIPGFVFFGRLPQGDGVGNYWMPTSIFVGPNTLIELRKAADGFGVNSEVVGGFVRGWTWPVRARLDWEARNAR